MSLEEATVESKEKKTAFQSESRSRHRQHGEGLYTYIFQELWSHEGLYQALEKDIKASVELCTELPDFLRIKL